MTNPVQILEATLKPIFKKKLRSALCCSLFVASIHSMPGGRGEEKVATETCPALVEADFIASKRTKSGSIASES